jgi:hypothetical protein
MKAGSTAFLSVAACPGKGLLSNEMQIKTCTHIFGEFTLTLTTNFYLLFLRSEKSSMSPSLCSCPDYARH